MTPKEYADKLTGKFYDLFSDELENTIAWSEAQACAKICVEELLLEDVFGMDEETFDKRNDFWQEVKSHL